MAEYNSNNRNNADGRQNRVMHIDDIYEVYDSSGEYQGTESAPSRSSGRSSGSAAHSSNRGSSSRERTSQQTRGQRPAGQRPVSRTSKLFRKRKRKFKKLLFLYIAVLVLILIIGSIAFALYCSSYEKSQPAHFAESIVKSYSSQQGIIDFITANSDKTNLMGNTDEAAALYATNIAGKAISYKENNDFRPNSPSYDITADGSTVAKVTLSKSGSGWAVSGLDISGYLPDTMTITVDAPTGSTVTVNGTTLDASYITSTRVPEIFDNVVRFIESPPQYDTYTLSGLISEPQITVTGASGKSLDITKTDNSYVASEPADSQFIASVEDRVYESIDNYATYFIHMSFSLANYIVYGSELYSYIFGSDTIDPIDTNLYNWEYIDSYEFAERSASNYIKYTDDCFTVDVKYALDMYFTDPTFTDNNQKMDATWIFVIEPLDGSWCIGDIIAH